MSLETYLLLPCILLLGACHAAGEPQAKLALAEGGADDILPYAATETTLANGLKVIVVPTGMPNLVSLQIPVQTGSRNEVEAGKTGFAHFFEHMMFRGTVKYPPDAYEAILTKAGARQNAYTTDDYTNYHVTFAKEDLEKILEIEADRFQNLSYSEEQFRTEALAVLGEYNKNFADPAQKLFEVMQNEAFTTHTYKHTTMGFIEDIQAMPDQIEYAKVFFDRWYRPEYTTVIVAGDVDAKAVLPLVERYWGAWKRGSYAVDVPAEPPFAGPKYVHVPWADETQVIVTLSFHGPAFSDTEKEAAALELFNELHFGETSPLYEKLVLREQKVDQFGAFGGNSVDPALVTVFARLFDEADAAYVRDEILRALAGALAEAPAGERLAEAKSNLRYSFSRRLDSTDAIAATLARFAHFQRSYGTLNNLYRLYASLSPEDLLAAGRRTYTDQNLIVISLSDGPELAGMAAIPAIASFAPPAARGASDVDMLRLPSPSPQLSLRFVFEVGSAADPAGKEGLAALSAAMISEAGSAKLRYEEIQQKLFPVAGGFSAQVDRELTVFAGSIHRDNLELFADVALPQLFEPGMRDEDFTRLKESLRAALVQDLRASNDEELGKEALQQRIFVGTGYGHPTQGTVGGLEAITLDDVRAFVAQHYTRANLTVGLAGNVPEELDARLERLLAGLPAVAPADDAMGDAIAAATGGQGAPQGRKTSGIEVDIIEKETRATAISFGFPIEVTRSHPDYPALYLARTWLGEHRSSMSHLYQRIREARGMNYGDYAYIEAFPGGMFQFFPPANVARRAQIFEIWIRPVPPEQAHHALRIAIHELDKLVLNGLTKEQFESTREYLSKNVFLMTATQDDQLGYALDSKFYGIPEYPQYMRESLAALTVDEVNAAIRRHLQAANLHVVCVTKDATGLRDKLLSDAPSKIDYASEKPADLLAEDTLIGARKLAIVPDKLRILPVAEVFAE